MPQGLIKYIIIITVILMVVVLSQHSFFKQLGKEALGKVSGPVEGVMTKGSGWVSDNITSKISGEVRNGGEAIQNKIEEEKKNFSENILEKTKNYFSGIADSIVNPGTPQNCPATETSPSSQPNP